MSSGPLFSFFYVVFVSVAALFCEQPGMASGPSKLGPYDGV